MSPTLVLDGAEIEFWRTPIERGVSPGVWVEYEPGGPWGARMARLDANDPRTREFAESIGKRVEIRLLYEGRLYTARAVVDAFETDGVEAVVVIEGEGRGFRRRSLAVSLAYRAATRLSEALGRLGNRIAAEIDPYRP